MRFSILILVLGIAANAQQRTARIPDSVSVERDIVYATYGAKQLHLDLYRPKKAEQPLPGIVVIRGGGWRSGDKQGFAAIAAALAEKGLAAACIEYRVLPEARFPLEVNDVKAAVRWMRAEGKRYQIRPDAIGAIGGSAGGHLVAMLGTSDKAADLEGDGGHAGVSSRVQAVVAMAPVVDFTQFSKSRDPKTPFDFLGASFAENPAVFAKASPVTYLSRDSAPILLIHSTVDKTVPIAQSELMLARCKATGVSAEMMTIEGAPHAFWNMPQWQGGVMERAAKFFHGRLDGK
jgi:pectinesterase